MAKIQSPSSIKDLPLALIKNMIALATSGFGVVVALAWNEAIKGSVERFVDPYLGKNSGVISLFIYALLMTILAVVVTMQLTNLEKRFEDLGNKAEPKNKQKEKK